MNANQQVLLSNNISVPYVRQALQIPMNNANDFARYCMHSIINTSRSIPSLFRIARHNVMLIALLFLMSMILVLWGTKHAVAATTPVVTTPVKWHPGHYYTIMSYGKNTSWYLSQVYKELKATSA